MLKFDAMLLACAAALLAACAQQQPPPPVAGPFPYPVQKQDPIRDTSQKLFSVEQILRQIQSLRGTVNRF